MMQQRRGWNPQPHLINTTLEFWVGDVNWLDFSMGDWNWRIFLYGGWNWVPSRVGDRKWPGSRVGIDGLAFCVLFVCMVEIDFVFCLRAENKLFFGWGIKIDLGLYLRGRSWLDFRVRIKGDFVFVHGNRNGLGYCGDSTTWNDFCVRPKMTWF